MRTDYRALWPLRPSPLSPGPGLSSQQRHGAGPQETQPGRRTGSELSGGCAFAGATQYQKRRFRPCDCLTDGPDQAATAIGPGPVAAGNGVSGQREPESGPGDLSPLGGSGSDKPGHTAIDGTGQCPAGQQGRSPQSLWQSPRACARRLVRARPACQPGFKRATILNGAGARGTAVDEKNEHSRTATAACQGLWHSTGP